MIFASNPRADNDATNTSMRLKEVGMERLKKRLKGRLRVREQKGMFTKMWSQGGQILKLGTI